jgi:D-alanyl-lipoteichoic acid acyltransferase DltB (MBOAT superfamily)
MAIGTAKLFGFRFRDNFLFPYFSRNMNEFWRRWHISLNTWFVDYVYIPLGGSRNGKWKTIRNTMIIFLLSGLWHGANWTFIGWGAYHGLLLVLLILMNRNTKYNEVVAKGRMLPTLKELGQMGLVFGLATIGWVLFRATGMKSTIKYLLGICTPSLCSIPYVGPYDMLAILLPIAIMLVVEWLQRDKQHGLDLTGMKWYVRYPIYVVMVGLIIYFWGSAQSFIYFQF